MAGNVFINYRRGDEPAAAGRLFDHLERCFPPDRLFLDVDSIPPGRDFVKELEIKVEACDVLLAVIGRNWLDARDAHGNVRLQDPKDFVRIEIATALRLDKRVIPVLINDAGMPSVEELPEPLQALAVRNAVRLTHERFKADAQGLVKAIEAAVEDTRAQREAAEAATAARRAEQATQVDRERLRLGGLSHADIVKAEELANWEFIRAGEAIDDLRDHLARFPGGVTQRMARARLEEVVWRSLGPTPDMAALQGFLAEFPAGSHAQAARAGLELPGGAADTRRSLLSADDDPAGQGPSQRPSQRPSKGSSRRLVLAGGGAALAVTAVGGAVFFMQPRAPSVAPRDKGAAAGQTKKVATEPGRPTHARPEPLKGAAASPRPAPGERTARSWEVGSPIKALALAPGRDIALIATTTRGLQLWGIAEGRALDTFGDPAKSPRVVTISSDGRLAVCANPDDSLSLWDISRAGPGGQSRLVRSFRSWSGDLVLAVALTSDGSLTLCGSTDATVEVWDTNTGREVRRLVGQSDHVTSVACSGDGHLAVSGSRDATIRLWELASGTSSREFKGHRDAVGAVGFSPDGRLVLSGGEDHSVRLWNVETGREVRTFLGHTDAVTSVAFTPNGRHGLSGSRDGTVRVWDVGNGRPARTFRARGAIAGIGVSNGGRSAVAGSDEGSLWSWPLADLCPSRG